MAIHQELKQALYQLQSCMETAGLWPVQTPPASAFSSQQPFSADTMDLTQWLRFVFIARLHALVDAESTMPANCDVTPALEAYLSNIQIDTEHRRELFRVMSRIDRLVTDN